MDCTYQCPLQAGRHFIQQVHGRVKKANVTVDRKSLAQLAVTDEPAFKKLIALAKE